MRKLINYFLKGLLVFAPTAFTVFIIAWAVNFIDKYLTFSIGDFTFRGGGFIVILILLPILGFLVSNYLGRKLFEIFEGMLTKIPLVKLLYNSIKDLIDAFAGDDKKFTKPALVSLNEKGNARIIGFITRESLDFFGKEDYVAVYMPQCYNFAGNVLIFHKDQVEPLDADPSDVMTFIVSAGVSGPKAEENKKALKEAAEE